MKFLLHKFVLSLILFVAFLASEPVLAQSIYANYGRLYNRPRLSNLSVEFGAGSAYYTGDLVKAASVGQQNNLLNLSFAVGARYQITEFISTRATLTYFRLQAEADRESWAGKSFKSNNVEVALEVIHEILPKSFTEEFRSPVNGYVFAGVGGLRFNPRFTETGKTQPPYANESYSKVAVCYPVGFGVNVHFFEDSWVGFEAGYRFTGTDFLDNASYTNYASPKNDGYYIFGFRASLQLYRGFAMGRQ